MKSPLSSILLVSCLTINATSALALNVNNILGEKTTRLSPSGKAEICAIATKKNPKFYDKDDLEDEANLCRMDFYKDFALCPKQTSTNPGVAIAEILNGNRAQTMQDCRSGGGKASVEAKFKNSITCSYTPSILAYYHFSRFLKAGRVPVAVLRTMDRQEHLNVAQAGQQYASSSATTKITWNQFLSAHSKLTDIKLFDDSRDFVYGALSLNPKGELKYSDLSASPYEVRYEKAFQKAPFVRLRDPRGVQEIALAAKLNPVPLIVQMKDMTDMILLDTLFSQQDRIGNLHYKARLYKVEVDPATGKKEFKSEKSKSTYNYLDGKWTIAAEDKPKVAAGAIPVREMIMKDNDCGVNKDNMMRKMSAIEGITHMSPRTYEKFMMFYKVAKQPATIDWMKNELQFASTDIGNPAAPAYGSYLSNLERARTVLYNNCVNGTLKLDLDVDALIPGNTLQAPHCNP